MSAHPSRSAIPEAVGLDLQAVERWFGAAVPDTRPPLSFHVLAGGYSNLTYRVADQRGRSWVLRRPPAGPLRPGAHSMEREWRILTALQTSAVPVPPTAAFCADPGVTGAEFYVMDHVEGIVIDSAESAAALTPHARRRLSDDIVATLVRLHQVDPGVVGRRPGTQTDSYVTKQLGLWLRQIDGAGGPRTREIVDVHKILSERRPPQRWTGLTHGDFRLGNMLVTAEGKIAAVLDWELWTVGDPLADLGWLAAWWILDTDDGWSPDRADGFPTAAELAADYQRLTGHDTSDIPYYIAFALWRLACISEGVYQRYAAGMMGRPPTPLDVLAARPRELAAAAREALL
ncbi:phosphotransferase family protein [Nocardia xishanensis]|uniref:phosphotransferase family protein n=1 Tax=Nocardia xishanensis TaxID=238964 RepID=UPI00082BB222|nr:phosphotransferase family protein [Nocardia xishanensis]